MYEKDGEQYFIVDSHLHFWDASPENWVPGQEEYAKGWISCFHDYQALGPPETHWPMDKFRKHSVDDFAKDIFEDGQVDFGILESTYLKDWYAKGFNAIEQNAALLERFPASCASTAASTRATARPACASSSSTRSATTSRA